MNEKKTCFVVMGFGEKTDFETGRKLDLDKTYRIIIRPAVEQAGLVCIRADDIVHAGVIDRHMYEQLLHADVVVADLSTSNLNAIYELGVRHALRPNTTIILAEREFRYPFDITSLVIRPYTHLGAGIDAEDAEVAKKALVEALEHLTAKTEPDSPVYTFIPTLNAPFLGNDAPAGSEAADGGAPPAAGNDQSVGVLMDTFLDARAREDWTVAIAMLGSIKALKPSDAFVVQQLAVATYKNKLPDVATSLDRARDILTDLAPDSSNDPETLGIWGAIHKRLWEVRHERDDLDRAVQSYGKGYNLKDDHYNGINFAFMLDVRAAESAGDDAIADRVWGRRVRERVIETVEAQLDASGPNDAGSADPADRFWLRATLVEAYAGVGRQHEADALREQAEADAPEPWMRSSLGEQLTALAALHAPGN
jgi:hypothetical protein